MKIIGSRTGWWNAAIDKQFLDELFPTEGCDETTLLIRDRFPGHMKESTAHLLEERNVFQLFIPGGRTGDCRLLDILINKLFKQIMRDLYHKWRTEKEQKATKTGNMEPPTK